MNRKNFLAAENILQRLLNEPTVSVPDAARLLGVGKSTVYAAVKSGGVPAIRVGNRVRIPSRWVWPVPDNGTTRFLSPGCFRSSFS
ncbi:excisionase family DNA-binding protein [Nocardia vinacea]|uniref:excisionase family DNA-binding protein n=1 Tax=Nocardia vinacea TaxID=96468 RepID=UPI0033EA862C